MEGGVLDGLDWALAECLARSPRAPFNRIGEVLGISDQTVARRYRRLQQLASLRVTGHLGVLASGAVQWFLRLHCTPDVAPSLAAALADRPDTSWVNLVSGGTEVTCTVVSTNTAGTTLLDSLANSRRITSMTAHAVLHRFPPDIWPGLTGRLDEDQLALLAKDTGQAAFGQADAVEATDLGDGDHAMLRVLRVDGRASAAVLARAAGYSDATARRRLVQLQATGQLHFEIDVDSVALGFPHSAHLWVSVSPSELHRIGAALAVEPNVPFVGATTGPSNLAASVLASSPEALYRFLSDNVGSHSGIVRFETAPIMKTLKRHGSRPAGEQLAT